MLNGRLNSEHTMRDYMTLEHVGNLGVENSTIFTAFSCLVCTH